MLKKKETSIVGLAKPLQIYKNPLTFRVNGWDFFGERMTGRFCQPSGAISIYEFNPNLANTITNFGLNLVVAVTKLQKKVFVIRKKVLYPVCRVLVGAARFGCTLHSAVG